MMKPQFALRGPVLLAICLLSMTMCATASPSRQKTASPSRQDCENVLMRQAEIAMGSDPEVFDPLRKALRDPNPSSVGAMSIAACQEHLTKKDIRCFMTWRTEAERDTCMSSVSAVRYEEAIKKIAPRN